MEQPQPPDLVASRRISTIGRILAANYDNIHNPVARQLMRRALPPLARGILNVLLGVLEVGIALVSLIFCAQVSRGLGVNIAVLLLSVQTLVFVWAGGLAFVITLAAAAIVAQGERAGTADVQRPTTLPGAAYVEGYLLGAAYHARHYFRAALWLITGFVVIACTIEGILFFSGGPTFFDPSNIRLFAILLWAGISAEAATAMVGMLLLGLALGVAVGMLRWPPLGAVCMAGGALLAVGAVMAGPLLLYTIPSDADSMAQMHLLILGGGEMLIPYGLYVALLKAAAAIQR